MKNLPIKIWGMLLFLGILFSSCSSDDDPIVTNLKIEGVLNDQMELEIDSSFKINVMLYPTDAVDKGTYKFGYNSSDTDIATVDDDGKITAKAVGTSFITVSPKNNTKLSKTFKLLSVKEVLQVTSIELSEDLKNGIDVAVGYDINLEGRIKFLPIGVTKPNDVIYTSSNPNIAVISEYGTKITGLKEGTTTINIVLAKNTSISAKFEVTVIPEVSMEEGEVISIELSEDIKAGISLLSNQRFDLRNNLIINPIDASNSLLEYKSSDAEVVMVTSAGLLISLKEGNVTITIASVKDPTITKSVEVKVLKTDVSYFDREGWGVETSHPTIKDNNAAVNGDKMSILDDDRISCLILGKPGKENVPVGDDIYFTVDMLAKKKFEVIKYTHRTNLTINSLKIHTASILGSNDGKTFTEIAADVNLLRDNAGDVEIVIDLGREFEFQYIRIFADKWDLSSSNTVQCSDFKVGSKTEIQE